MTNCVICYTELEEVPYHTKLLRDQINVIFILKHIFEVKPNQLRSYLQKWGNPGDWIKVCDSCDLDITHAKRIYWRVQEISRKFDQTKCSIQEKIKSSEQRNKNKGMRNKRSGSNGVLNECRQTFCQRRDNEAHPRSPLQNPLLDEGFKLSESALGARQSQITDHDQGKSPNEGETEDFGRIVNENVNEDIGSFYDHHDDDDATPLDDDSSERECQTELKPPTQAQPEDEGDFEEETVIHTKRILPQRRSERALEKPKVFEQVNTEEDKECVSVEGESDVTQNDQSESENGSKLGIENIKMRTKISGSRTGKTSTLRTMALRRSKPKPKTQSTKPKPRYKLDLSKVTLTEDNSGSCNICQKVFDTLRKLTDHVKYVHDKACEATCTVCGTSYRRASDMKVHMANVHGVGGVKCNICHKSFVSNGGLEIHKKSMHSEGGALEMADCESLSCVQCEKTFKNIDSLKHHVRKVHLRRFEKMCSVCGKKLVTSLSMKKHLAIIHGIGKWDYKPPPRKPTEDIANSISKPKSSCQCHICGKKFSSQKNLNNHVKFLHEKLLLKECDLCRKGFRNKCHLLDHKANVHQVGDFKCDADGCIKVFWKNEHLEDHKKRNIHVTMSKPKLNNCQFCNKVFKKPSKVKEHEQAVHLNKESKPFHCELCQKNFASKAYLKDHIRRGHKIKRGLEKPRKRGDTTKSKKSKE